MDTLGMFKDLISNILQLATALIITLLQRWLLELSSFDKDLIWLKRTALYDLFQRSRFYVGKDLLYQLRARVIWKASYKNV